MSLSDHDLLCAYARDGSQAAFAEVVQRHLGLVYSAARRQLRSPHLAEEVAQSVFLDLARNALRLAPDQPLAAWLHLVTRRTAVDVIRREARQRAREQQAAALTPSAMKVPSPDWATIEPLLDEAVDSLNAADRAAILLRFFENKSLRDVGAALGASEDAAQKRVTRALGQLRGFFLRRGVAVTAAGLATDLSAHALSSVPTGLGAVIAVASAQIVPVAVHSGTAALAMTTMQKLGLAAAFAAAAVTAYEANAIYRQHTALETTRREFAALSTEINTLRASRRDTADQLKLAREQLEARRLAQSVAAPAAPADAALDTQMKTWLAQIDQLHRFFAENPRLEIPELQFLSEQDWFAVAAAGPISSELDFRRASAQLRDRAENIFTGKLSRALSEYVRTHGDQLPESPHELVPYFDPPVDPVLLDRYEMLQHGKAGEVPPRERTRMIAAQRPVDVEFDVFHWAGTNGYGNNGNYLAYQVGVAQAKFRRENPGQSPIDAARLLPYLKSPIDPVVLQKFLSRDQKGEEP
jgi:RNA polymerase sigma factor (sigma-70 family)